MFVNRHQKAAAECGGFHLYKQYFLIQLKSAMQLRPLFLTCIGQFLVSFNVFIGIYFMFQRFHTRLKATATMKCCSASALH